MTIPDYCAAVCRFVRFSPDHAAITAELTGLPSLIDKFIDKMTKHGIIELSRSGLTALEKGDTNINGITE